MHFRPVRPLRCPFLRPQATRTELRDGDVRRFGAMGFALVCVSLIAGCGSPDTKPAPVVDTRPTLSPERTEAHLASFDVIWETVRDVHYDPELNGADWDGLRATLRPRVAEARTDGEARAAMAELLAALGQSHFAVVPADVYDEISTEDDRSPEDPAEPASRGHGEPAAHAEPPAHGDHAAHGDHGDHAEAAEEVREPLPPRNRKGHGQPGFDIAVVDDRALVIRVTDGSSATEQGVAMGWVLDAVDGRKVSRTIDAVRSFSTGGEADLILRRSILHELSGDPGEQVDVTFLDGEDREHIVRLTLAPPKAVMGFGNMPKTPVDWEITRDGTIGIFRLGIFMHFPIRVELQRFIDENPDLTGLIIDLRGNPGGIGFMANGLAGHLIDEPGLRLGTMISRDSEIHFAIQPQVTVFEGPIAILIDGGSASTSEIMAAGFQDLGRARLFGSNSAGAALPSLFRRLPNGDAFQYAIANYVSSGGEVLEGDGVAPDVPVTIDRASLLDGVDPVLHAAQEWIRTQEE